MKTTSKQIEIELNQTTNRLDELMGMRNGISANLETLQKGFIDGNTSLDDLQTEQGKLTILNESIRALEAKQNELRSAFQKASLTENRQSLLEKSKQTAVEAEAIHNEYSEMRNEFHNSVASYAEKLTDKLISYRNKQREFERIGNQIQTGFKELEQIGLSAETFKIVTANYINYPPFEYGEAVAVAERLCAAKLDKAAQAKRTAEYNARKTQTAAV